MCYKRVSFFYHTLYFYMSTDSTNYGLPLSCFSIIFLIFMSAFGSSNAITTASTSSIMYTQKRSIITQAYIAVLMASTIFMYAFIIALGIIFKFNGDYQIQKAIDHSLACFLYGICSYFCGNAMSTACKHGFSRIAKTPKFFFSFILVMSSIEVMLIFCLIFCLTLL